MAPMTTWASNDDGTVSDEEEADYRRRAKDVGLVITGCPHVQANGVGFTGVDRHHRHLFRHQRERQRQRAMLPH
jgi:2,4-dienoyl-CoA reductase-like NADH-dependent reductase (Old Yellow Enzyme family)